MQQFVGSNVSLDDIDVCGSRKCQTCLGIDSDDRRHSAEQSAAGILVKTQPLRVPYLLVLIVVQVITKP